MRAYGSGSSGRRRNRSGGPPIRASIPGSICCEPAGSPATPGAPCSPASASAPPPPASASRPTLWPLALPTLDGRYGPLTVGITSAAVIAFLLAVGRRLSRRPWVAIAVALVAAVALTPVKVEPWPLQLL